MQINVNWELKPSALLWMGIMVQVFGINRDKDNVPKKGKPDSITKSGNETIHQSISGISFKMKFKFQ